MLHFNTRPTRNLADHPHLATFRRIEAVCLDIDWVKVISTTFDSCVVIAPSADLASITSDILLGEGIYSKTLKGHFIDAYYLTIRYE